MGRLGRLLRAPNWRYAFGELALIVAGVLIALAVNAQWENHLERRREHAYLAQLLADVSENERRIQQAIREDSAQFEVGLSRVLRAAHRGPPFAPDSLGIYLGTSEFRPLTGTYTALVQSGNIDLIRDDSLRFRLLAYAGEMEGARETLRATESATVHNVENWTQAIWRHTSPGAQSHDWPVLLRDPAVLSALEVQRGGIRVRIQTLRNLLPPTRQLRTRLESQLRVANPVHQAGR